MIIKVVAIRPGPNNIGVFVEVSINGDPYTFDLANESPSYVRDRWEVGRTYSAGLATKLNAYLRRTCTTFIDPDGIERPRGATATVNHNCPKCNKPMGYDDGRDAYTCPCGYIGPNGPIGVAAWVARLDEIAAELDRRGIEKLASEVDAVAQQLMPIKHSELIKIVSARPLDKTFKSLDDSLDELEVLRDSVLHGGSMTVTGGQLQELVAYVGKLSRVVSQIDKEFQRRQQANR